MQNEEKIEIGLLHGFPPVMHSLCLLIAALPFMLAHTNCVCSTVFFSFFWVLCIAISKLHTKRRTFTCFHSQPTHSSGDIHEKAKKKKNELTRRNDGKRTVYQWGMVSTQYVYIIDLVCTESHFSFCFWFYGITFLANHVKCGEISFSCVKASTFRLMEINSYDLVFVRLMLHRQVNGMGCCTLILSVIRLIAA